MRTKCFISGAALAGLYVLPAAALAQAPKAAAKTVQPVAAATPATPTVAALVNGQPVTEVAVQRALKRVAPAEHAKARPEILDFLVDNLLIEQYLVQQRVTVEAPEIQARLTEIKTEMQKQKQDFAKMLQELSLTEQELMTQIAADLRWEKFALSLATDAALQDMFNKNIDMFNGSSVRARHILITPAANDAKGMESAKATLLALKKEVLLAGDAAVAKLPPTTDTLAREAERRKAVDLAFSAAANKHSACPSKREGGDISWFPRAGSMVEPFAKAAFALKDHEISDPVATPFGLHLIMQIGRRPGQQVTFDKMKDDVKEVYCGQLRENLCAQLRQSAKISITPVAMKN